MQYTTRLTWESLLLFEMQTTVRLLLEGKTWSESKEEILEHNLYQYEKPSSTRKRLGLIQRRLNFLDWEWYTLFSEDVGNAKILALYTIYRDNNLFESAITKVIWHKIQSRSYELHKNDILQLFGLLKAQDESITARTKQTIAKLSQVILKILKESEVLKNDRLTPIYIPRNIREYLEKKELWVSFISSIS